MHWLGATPIQAGPWGNHMPTLQQQQQQQGQYELRLRQRNSHVARERTRSQCRIRRAHCRRGWEAGATTTMQQTPSMLPTAFVVHCRMAPLTWEEVKKKLADPALSFNKVQQGMLRATLRPLGPEGWAANLEDDESDIVKGQLMILCPELGGCMSRDQLSFLLLAHSQSGASDRRSSMALHSARSHVCPGALLVHPQRPCPVQGCNKVSRV